MKKHERLVIFLIAVYFLIKDTVECDNKYKLYKKIYIDEEYVKESDINNKYLISNASRWKQSINDYIDSLNDESLIEIINEIMDIYHKIS